MRRLIPAIPSYILAVILFVWLAILRPMGTWVGRDFPDESQIQYHEGVLKIHRERVNRSYVIATISLSGNDQNAYYYCGYAAHHYPAIANCIDKKDIELYNNKPAKVGWYLQKDFLWFSNPHRQLVSLEVDGKTVISYQDTLRRIERAKKDDYSFNIMMFVFMFFVFGMFFFIPYYYIRKERRMQQSET